MEFNLEESDIQIPTHCPVLGIPLSVGNGKAHRGSPTIDRIDSTGGYVRGNVIVVSQWANTIKSDATPAQIRAVADFYERLIAGETWLDRQRVYGATA